jgi:hypothetical protein
MKDISQSESSEKNTKYSGKNSIPGIALRLILALITGIIIGTTIYFTAAGWIPYLDQRVFDPIKNSQSDIQALQATQQSLENQIQILQNSDLSHQATLEYMESGLRQNSDYITLLATVEMSAQFVVEHNQLLATLEVKLGSTNRNLSALATAQIKSSELQQDLSLLKVLDLLTLTNQYLVHANFGQAENQLLLVKTELESLYIKSPAFQQTFLHDLLNLVDETIEDLPENFPLAENKVELAIQMALQGFPDHDQNLTLTATPYLTPTRTPTP